jgi:pimeloyl-ACP methyl ester carboxylesterase
LDDDDGSNSAEVTARAPTAGTYTVLVSTASCCTTQIGAASYVLTVSGLTGTVSPPVVNNFTATPSTITTGQSSVLSWSTTNATTVVISGVAGAQSGQGSTTVNPGATTTYTLTATGSGGSASATTTIVVQSAISPAIVSFVANPSTITSGQSSTLSWATTNATTVSISGVAGTQSANSSVSVSPATTKTYTLTATGSGLTATATTTIVVNELTGTLNRLRFGFGSGRRRAVAPLADSGDIIFLAKRTPDERFVLPVSASINGEPFTDIDVVDGVLTLSGAPGELSLEDWFPRGSTARVGITNGDSNYFGLTLSRLSEEISVAALSTSVIQGDARRSDGATTPVKISLFQDQGGATNIVSTRTTWVVIHGRLNSSETPQIQDIAEAIKATRKDDQVLLLDWKDAAKATSPAGATSDGEEWIEAVGKWAAGKLQEYGFTGHTLNLVGHSWGSYVADELAEGFGRVNVIVGLDPAIDTIGSDYDPNDRSTVNFAEHSELSLAFHSSPYGSETSPTTADASFSVGFLDPLADRHGWIKNLFTSLLRGTGEVSQLFTLKRLIEHSDVPWQLDRYYANDAYATAPRERFYEGVILSGPVSLTPKSLRYFKKNGEEVTIREHELVLSIASITPTEKQTMIPGLPLTFSIRVVDEEDVPVQGVKIIGMNYVKDEAFATDPTDRYGVTAYTTLVPFGTGAGTYGITFTATLQGFSPSSPITRFVKVVTLPSTLSITSVMPTTTQTMSVGQSKTFAIQVVDGNTSPKSGTTVTVQDNLKGQTLASQPTDGNGATSYTTSVPSGTAAGTYDIRFTASLPGYTSSTQVTRSIQVIETGTQQLLISTTALNPSTATIGVRYAALQAMTATGGQPPYTWSATGLPAGIGIHSSSGEITGTPTQAGVFNISVGVKDSGNPQKTADRTLVLTVVAGAPLTTTLVIPSTNAIVDTFLTMTPVTASGGLPPYTFALSGGALPQGLTFNPRSGQISGTPTASLSTRTFTVTVFDTLGASSVKSFSLSVTAVVTSGSVTSTLKALTGSNSPASLTRQLLYASPILEKDGSNPATFNNVPSGTYLLEGYHEETFWGEELWASKNVTVTAGQATNATLSRNFPYASIVIRNDTTGALIAAGQIVPLGTTLRAEVTVHNDVIGTTQSSKVQFRFDRNHSSSYDFEDTSITKSISGGGTQTYTFTHMPATAGIYDYALAVYTTVGGHSVLTDSWGWTDGPLVTAAAATGTVTSTLKTLGGSNSSPSLTRQVLYTSPVLEVNGSNPATFNNVPAGTYLLEGYHEETFWGEELWASKNVTVTAGQTTNATLSQNFPYASIVIRNDTTGALIAAGQIVPLGTTLRAEVTVHNDVIGTMQDSKVQFRFDRNHSSSYDFEDTSSTKSIAGGGTQIYTFRFIPGNAGTYDFALAVHTTIAGDSVMTDSWGWTSGPIVSAVAATGSVISTLKALNGSNSSASTTRQWLYTSPLLKVDGSNPATFNNVAAGTYLLEGYHEETFWGEELWASKQVTVNAGQNTSATLNRNYPYASLVFKNDATGALLSGGQSVPMGTRLRAEVTLYNIVTGATQTGKVRFLFDRSHSSSYDFDQTSETKTIVAGGTQSYVFTYTPDTAATYDYTLAVYTMIEGDPVLTDSWGWTSGFTVLSGSGTCTESIVQTMVQEYANPTYANSLRPTCSDFKSSGGSTNFSWSELNGGFAEGNPHEPWGMVRTALTTGLQATRANYNRGRIRLSSGYRCPHGNALADGVNNSYHTHGRAADMYSLDHAWTEQEFALLRNAALNTGNAVELLNWTSYTDHHLHAAW